MATDKNVVRAFDDALWLLARLGSQDAKRVIDALHSLTIHEVTWAWVFAAYQEQRTDLAAAGKERGDE